MDGWADALGTVLGLAPPSRRVADLQPDQRVTIYGDVVVTVLGVTRATDWNADWVRLRYRRHFASGTHLDGWYELPAGRRLALA